MCLRIICLFLTLVLSCADLLSDILEVRFHRKFIPNEKIYEEEL